MRRFLGLVLLGSLLPRPTPALAAGNADFPIPGGHWYSEANGFGFPTQIGYPVFDTSSVKLWSEFQRLGGVPVLGYLVQAFQKAILQWHPDSG